MTLPEKRQRIRTNPCVIPGCDDEARRASVFPICVNHLLLVWKHVDNSGQASPWDRLYAKASPIPSDHVVTSDELEARRLAARQRQRELATTPGTLYALDTKNNGMIKIGWTGRELWQRLEQYEPGFRLIVSVPGTRADERDVHRSLKTFRATRREWYFEAPEVVRQINDWIAIRNTIIAQKWSQENPTLKAANPGMKFPGPSLLPRFTSLAEWQTEDYGTEILPSPTMPGPKSRSSTRRVG